ncbi:hypothetical protein BASA_1651 [Bifidobacterium animalis subsp. animalis]|nr:hypothetical protein BASA_1651 [Bifidobacterium animalis subsp. animalis]
MISYWISPWCGSCDRMLNAFMDMPHSLRASLCLTG